jgi:ubiquinol-cytochrome c reductase subunit 8
MGSQTQKGVTTYALSANRQKPLAGALHNAIFNTFRRTRHQILFWLTPMVVAYGAMQWAMEKYVYNV